ncbi:MAG: hypothetical protein Q9192_002471, partial [Flavoplaca navasiana]
EEDDDDDDVEEEEEERLERHVGVEDDDDDDDDDGKGEVVVIHASSGRFGGADGEIGEDGAVVPDDSRSISTVSAHPDLKANSSSTEYRISTLRRSAAGAINGLNLTPPSLSSLEKLVAGDTERVDLDDGIREAASLLHALINANESSLSWKRWPFF